MNPEDPRDIKCPHCGHRMPLDVSTYQVRKVICSQCKTIIENIEDSIAPSSSSISELPDKQEPELEIVLQDLIKDDASGKNITGVALDDTGTEMAGNEKTGLNLDLPELIQGNVGESGKTDENHTPDFAKFTKTTDLDFDQEFAKKQQELAHEYAVAQSQIVNWDETNTVEDQVDSKITKIKLIKFTTLLFLLIATVIFITFKGNYKRQNNNLTLDFAEKNELGNEVNKESETIGELLLEVGATELHSRATTALKNFLDAENAKSRLQFCREPERVQPLMNSYYSKHNDGPISYRKFSMVGDNETGLLQGFYLLKISFNDFSIRPVIISYENRKMLIDWESFIGYSEMSLDEFVDNKLKEPTMFRLHAKIDDYFNFQFNDKDHRCLYLRNPKDTEAVYGYINRGSSADDHLSEIIESGKSINFIIVNLQYPDQLGGKNQVIINEIIASGWLLSNK